MYFSIGLDNYIGFYYYDVMNNIFFSQKSKSISFKNKYQKKNELITFVADQFKKLAKKNLRIPVTLYHL
jgi:hypothetical protein